MARAALDRVAAAHRRAVDRVDVTDDIELERDYGDRVPVVLLDGKEHGYWRVEEDRLRICADLRWLESSA